MRRRGLRVVLGLLALADAATGLYAVLAPHSFYRHVVGVDLLGPYNQHLLTDVGGFYLGFGVLFAGAAATLGAELTAAACAAACLTSALHLGYHLAHLERFSSTQTVEQTVGLAVALALPAVGLGLTRRGARRTPGRA